MPYRTPRLALAGFLLLSVSAFLHAADAPKAPAPKPKAATAPKAQAPKPKAPATSRREGFGIVLGVDAPNLGIAPSHDGYQPGAGFIIDINRNFSLRGLALLGANLNAGAYDIDAGLGAALLWRPVTGRASPYLGALGGASLDAMPGSSVLYLYGGGAAGIDVRLLDKLYAYAEYRVIAKRTVSDLSVGLDLAANPGFGFIAYF